MKTAVVLLSSLAYATAYICCPPTKWEGMFGESGGYVVDKTRQTGTFTFGALFHQDISIQKTAIESYHLKIIQDFAKKIQYMIHKGVCTKTRLQGSAEDNLCIPDHARYLNTLTYQVGDFVTDNYVYEVTQQGMKTKLMMNVERTMCIPFGFQGLAHTPDATAIFSGGYFNTTSSVKDPSVFDVPDICKNSSIPIKEPDAETTSHFIEALISTFDETWW